MFKLLNQDNKPSRSLYRYNSSKYLFVQLLLITHNKLLINTKTKHTNHPEELILYVNKSIWICRIIRDTEKAYLT